MSRSHASGCVKSRTDACIRDCESTQNDIRRATEHEVMRSITEGEGKASSMTTKKHHKKFLVAMRLWDTPVLIPNTKVKT